MRGTPRHRAAGVLAFVAVVLLGTCSSSGGPKARPADDPGPPVINVTLTKTGCSPQSFTLKPGPVRFSVTNPEPPEKTKVGLHDDPSGRPTEMEIQNAQGHEINDVEGVQPGRTRSFLVNLEAHKTYRVRCPETQTPWGTITVTP